MRYFYAELNGSGVVKCILESDRQITSATMIPIASFDRSLFGMRHVGDGVFEAVP
jgi:hypothetical protein